MKHDFENWEQKLFEFQKHTHISYSADQSQLSTFDTFQFCKPKARLHLQNILHKKLISLKKKQYLYS